jgi:hypothetical protein
VKKILLLKDLKGWFWKTYPTPSLTKSLDIEKICRILTDVGLLVEVSSYHTFDFSRDYHDYGVIYGSSEDHWGGTKDFMEDILLWLMLQGATLLPDFKYFRAHHNKVMMELLRYEFKSPELCSVDCQVFPSAKAALEASIEYPAVVKSASGAGSQTVYLARERRELKRAVDQASRVVFGLPYIYFKINNLFKFITRQPMLNIYNHKFIIQPLIKNLEGDYKVLVFGNHFFILHRLNRPDDFRASGSGKFVQIPEAELNPVLNFARLCQDNIDAPHLSLDIGFDGERCYLIEFQCISFGFKALSLSTYHYEWLGNDWRKIDGPADPEEEYCQALQRYLNLRQIPQEPA